MALTEFGSLLVKIFESYIYEKDTLHYPEIKKAVDAISTPKLRIQIARTFENIAQCIKQQIKKCPHPEDQRLVSTHGCEECRQCGGYRRHKNDDGEMHSFGYDAWDEWRW